MVTVDIGLLFQRPPLQLLTASLIDFYEGSGVVSFAGRAKSYGIRWNLRTVPIGYGRDVGVFPTYYDRVVQLVLEWDVGTPTSAQVYQLVNIYEDLGLFWYDIPSPARLRYYTMPGVSISLYEMILG